MDKIVTDTLKYLEEMKAKKKLLQSIKLKTLSIELFNIKLIRNDNERQIALFEFSKKIAQLPLSQIMIDRLISKIY